MTQDQLAKAMSILRPGENVSPDMSTYSAILAKWRGTGDCPSEADCETAYTTWNTQNWAQRRRNRYDELGCTEFALTIAHWKKTLGDATDFDALQLLRVQVQTEIPKPE